MAAISLQGLSKHWGEAQAVKNIDIEVKSGDFTVLLGPSGCGKSTTLRLIAGLDRPRSGRILIYGRNVTQLPPAQRWLSMVFQSYALFPHLSVRDTILSIGLPYFASAFGIFLLRQTFKTVPRELDEAATVEGASALQILMQVYVPLTRPVYLAFGLVSVSTHWNNFLWPLIVTHSVESRPLTVGLQVFSSTDQGVDWSIITAATLMTSAPLLLAFLLFQRQFVQSFMRTGIR